MVKIYRPKRLAALSIIIVLVSLLIVPVAPVSGWSNDIGGTFTVTGATVSSIQTYYVHIYGASVSWITDIPATSQVFYDKQSHENIHSYAHQTTEDASLVTNHYLRLTGLSSSTVYYFRVKSVVDSVETVSDEFTFITLTSTPSVSSPEYYEEIIIFGELSLWPISYDGYLLADVVMSSTDGQVTILIPKGTLCLDEDGKRLTKLAVATSEDIPELPESYMLLGGIGYQFSPGGAIFKPPFKITLAYDEDELPEKVKEESLVIVYYDEDTAQWVELESTVDTEDNTVSAFVEHFTTFAVIGKSEPPPVTPVPASFSISSLSISPDVVAAGEMVTVRVLVSNSGGESGSYTATLKINGVVEAMQEMTVRAGLSKEVSFSVFKEAPGNYAVDINGLSGSFTVKSETTTPISPLPAAFAVDNLTIDRQEIDGIVKLNLTVNVTNTGGTEGRETLILKINGITEAEKTVTMAAGASQEVEFTITRTEPGIYNVDINGLTGSFTIMESHPPDKTNWPLIIGIMVGIIMIGLIIVLIARTRRRGVR